MKIHTTLSRPKMLDALRHSGAPIYFHKLEEVGSRTHRHGYHVTLEGSGGRNNTGLYGAGTYNGATWDEWGAFFGALFELDPEARCGGTVANPVYRNAGHFHYLTAERFIQRFEGTGNTVGATVQPTHLPVDTHPRHRWERDGWGPNAERKCAKCTATQPPFISGADWS